MKAPTPKVLPVDPDYLSLVQDAEIVRKKCPRQLPLALRLIQQRQKKYKEIYISLAKCGHPKPGFQDLLHAVYSDLRHAEQGYPPQIHKELAKKLIEFARTKDQAHNARRLIAHHNRVESEIALLAKAEIGPTLFGAQQAADTFLHFENDRINKPVRISANGVLRTPTAAYQLSPLPNQRSLLRIQAAILRFESVKLPYQVKALSNRTTKSLKEHLLAAYAARSRQTVSEARRSLGLTPSAPTRALKRPESPADRVLTCLPAPVLVDVLHSEEPNLEYRALKAFSEVAGLTVEESGYFRFVSPGTIRHWKNGRHLDPDLAKLGRAVKEQDIRAVRLLFN